MNFKKMALLILAICLYGISVHADTTVLCKKDYIELGDSIADEGEFKIAISMYKKALKCASNKKLKIGALASLSASTLKTGNKNESEKYLLKLLKISPDNKWAKSFHKENFKKSTSIQEKPVTDKAFHSRYGKFTITENEKETEELFYNKKPLSTRVIANSSLDIVKAYQLENSDIIITRINGGNGCPALLHIIEVSKSDIYVTPDFGTCSDLISFNKPTNINFITMPGLDGNYSYSYSGKKIHERITKEHDTAQNDLLESSNEVLEDIDMGKVIKLSTNKRYNQIFKTYMNDLVITSLQDKVIIQNIIANRGRCKVSKNTLQNLRFKKLPVPLFFGDSASFSLRNGCRNLLEVEVKTNYGSSTWNFE